MPIHMSRPRTFLEVRVDKLLEIRQEKLGKAAEARSKYWLEKKAA